MKIPFGLAGRLAFSFVALAFLSQYLNYRAASESRSTAVHQREVDKIKTVARVIEPRLQRETEWVKSVSRLLQGEIARAMQPGGSERAAALAGILDQAYLRSRVDVLEVTDAQGIVLYRAQEPARTGDLANAWGIEEALGGKGNRVSSRDGKGAQILFIEPIWAGGQVVGTVSAGIKIDEKYINALSAETGTELALVDRTGAVVASSQHGKIVPDRSAISEAFRDKIPVYRIDETMHRTVSYLPVLIVDDAWVIMAEIDSSSAFALLERGDAKSALMTLFVVDGAILVILIVLFVALRPLRDLRRRAEEMVAKLTGKQFGKAADDDIGSLVEILDSLTGTLLDRNCELNEQRADLRISAAAFESQEATMITDANMVVLRVNKAFAEITGFAADEVVGRMPGLFNVAQHSASLGRDIWQAVQRVGGWRGEVQDRRKNGETYPMWLTVSAVKGDDGAVTNYILSHSDLTERKKAEETIEELAFFDSLTHLPNRKLLMDRLRQAMTSGNRNEVFGAVLMIDLDYFKTLNDTIGHENGDLLLRQVAERLTQCVREEDTVARLGGDEFVVVLGSLNANVREAATHAEFVGEKILVALNHTYQLKDIEHRSTASIGATLFHGHETGIDDLLKQAELAMYKAKDTGRNALRFFDPVMQTSVIERASLEKDLRSALAERQFVLHYQPQVVNAGYVTGAEVLIRWSHPQRGLVSPAAFIPLAEETGLILPIGQWVLETVCAKLSVWATQPDMAHLTVAVNVSARQFRHPDFVEQVLSVLRENRTNPQMLKLELTESLLVDNVQEVIEKMRALQTAGVCFSLDDFGTGYSSLSYLKLLPLEQLKIDQSFVRDVLVDPNDAAIARTVITLAQSLGLGVIAEGVETEEQRDFLSDSGCHAYQGYYFSKPLAVEDFEAFVKRQPALLQPDSPAIEGLSEACFFVE